MGREEVLKRCPVCGGALYVDHLMQYSVVYRLGKNGVSAGCELPHTRRKVNDGPMDCMAVRCERGDFATDYDLHVETPATMTHAVVFQRDGVFYIEEA